MMKPHRHFFLFALVPCILLVPILATAHAEAGRQTLDLSGTGWSLWRDMGAQWQHDELFLPPADLAKVPVNPPTGGWQSLGAGSPVAIPGTAEEYLGAGTGVNAAVPGVTWWRRVARVPAAAAGKRVRLQFDAVRLRAEVYVNRRLAAYDIVGNTPFEADVTDLVKPGEEAEIAVRVTNPGGNYDWRDVDGFTWGKYHMPSSHGFGGITGGVRLVVTDPVYIEDVYVQNTPTVTTANAIATINNTTGHEVLRDFDFSVSRSGPEINTMQAPRQGASRRQVLLEPGRNEVRQEIHGSTSGVWSLDHPNVCTCTVTMEENGEPRDEARQDFGFRWFSPDGIGKDAMLRLNWKRIVLRTAISWGFWPVNGLFPSPELAKKQVSTARELGLNMLNFHRYIGSPVVMDEADRQGLLYFEEPGGYVSGAKDAFAQAICREKLLRMVKRDRSHPSLIIYNMINEQWDKFGAQADEALFDIHRQDMREAHAIDPSRTIVYTSAWAGRSGDPHNDKAKMNMRPFDPAQYMEGWWDYHRAGGPETWKQAFYTGPDAHYGLTKNKEEIVYWGEEGAVSAPPRLALIRRDIEAAPRKGWDSQVYLDWYKAFDDYLTAKALRGAFPDVDALCRAMGRVSLEHQGRKIEDTRICDVNDGYAINGWESELIDNHSGIVDCYRNPKSDPGWLAYYNKPYYIAVKPRRQIVRSPGEVEVDFYGINEIGASGPGVLHVRATEPDGREVFAKDYPVTLKGGNVFAELLAENVRVPVTAEGICKIEARADFPSGAEADGRDTVLGVDWATNVISGSGAVLENGSRVKDFLAQAKGVTAPVYDENMGALDWLVIARGAKAEPYLISGTALRTGPGGEPGLRASFFAGRDFQSPLKGRTDTAIDFSVAAGQTPDPGVPLTENYCIRWEGEIIPPETGQYTLKLLARDGVRLWVGGKPLVDQWKEGSKQATVKVQLTAGKPEPIRLEHFHTTARDETRLLWLPPGERDLDARALLERASRDGTTLLFVDKAETWIGPLAQENALKSRGSFEIGDNWLGGQYFVKEHPLFKGLPVNDALNWPYQAVVAATRRMGLDIEGEQLVAGCYNSWPFHLGTAVGVIPWGKGRIVISTLNLCDNLASEDSSAEVARKLMCNYLEWAGKK